MNFDEYRAYDATGLAKLVADNWTADGLPMGIQFVAPLSGEALLVRLAAQLEQALPWADRVAPV